MKVALALGSGGARGYAHIGVIEEVEARGYEIVDIAGSSMGALVGGLYAAGCLGDFREWAVRQRWVDVLRMLDLSLDSMGLIRGDKVFAMLRDMVGVRRIESLDIRFTAVATDLTRLKEIWFQRGDLLEALRASIAIPSLFTPVMRDGRMLVDGGVLNPVPIAPTVSSQADLIVAVDLNPSRDPMPETSRDLSEARQLEDDMATQGAMARLGQWLPARLGNSLLRRNGEETSLTPDEEEASESDPPREQGRLNRLEVIYQSLEAMQTTLTQFKIAGYPPDVLVRIPKETCRFYEFHSARRVIQVGREATAQALDECLGRSAAQALRDSKATP